MKFDGTKKQPVRKEDDIISLSGSVSSSNSKLTSSKAKLVGSRNRYQLCKPLRCPFRYDLDECYNWSDFLDQPDFETIGVNHFASAPLNDIWHHIAPGMKLEVPNPEYPETTALGQVYWIAQVVKITGYKALMRYEGYNLNDPSHDFWVNLCCEDVHPVGWCAEKSRPLVPPQSIQDHHPDKRTAQDWKSFLAKRLTGARTLPLEFHDRVLKALTSRFKPGMRVEVADRKKLCQVKPSIIKEVIGHRLRVKYVEVTARSTPKDLYETESDVDEEDVNEFWTHEKSPLLHPVGWAVTVGHELDSSAEYRRLSREKARTCKFDADDATSDLFDELKRADTSDPGSGLFQFQVGMKLEAIDPLDLSSIVCATVDKVLADGYLMIKFDGAGDSFCYHETSACIFPVGFCNQHGIRLKPPRGASSKFDWQDYLKQTKSIAAPVALFNNEVINHKFRIGTKLESTDLMDPRLVCVATVADVKGRLLRIHFDGWEDSFDQWTDCFAPETYPIGWCEMVGYKLEAPKDDAPTPQKKRTRTVPSKLKKKKKMKGNNSSFYSDENAPSPSDVSTLAGGGSDLPEILTPQSDETEQQPYVPNACRGVSLRNWTSQQVRSYLESNAVGHLFASYEPIDGQAAAQLQINNAKTKYELTQQQAEEIIELFAFVM